MIFRVLFLVLLMFVSFSCSKKEKRTVIEDNITAPLNIDSIVESTNIDIADGNAKFSSGNFNAAIESYEKGIRENRATALYNIGVSYYLLNNTPLAELNFREAVKADPNFDEAVINLIAVLAEQGPDKAREAEQYINRIIHTNKSSKVFIEIGNVYLSIGDTAKAMYYYQMALAGDKKSPFVIENYANLLISTGAYDEGIRLLEGLHDKNFTINYNLANAYYSKNSLDSAVNYANEALYSPNPNEAGYNKLAALFHKLKKYNEEIQTLRILISGNARKDYRIRLIKAYLTLSQNDKALDEVNDLIEEFPVDEEVALLKYNVLVLSDTSSAGKYIRQVYKQFNSDKVLSYYAKHVCYFEKTQKDIVPLISVNRQNGWLALARTVYALKMGKYKEAEDLLKGADSSNGHDYFAYNSFINIKNKRFAEASKYSAGLEFLQYDTFWYKLVTAWNLRKPQDILALGSEYKNSSLISIRPPAFEFNIRPVLQDMSFTYRFEDKGVDVASMLATPVFLKPDETAQFLITGRGALKERDKNSVIDKLEGIKRNNSAIEFFKAFKFEDAKNKFLDASKYLSNNNLIHYNLALTYFNLGDNEKAKEVIDKALSLDKSNGYINLVAGFLNYRVGNIPEARSSFDKARMAAVNNLITYPTKSEEDIKLLYLSVLASERANRRAEVEVEVPADTNGFTATCVLFMDYFDTYDAEVLKKLANSPLFRVANIKKLLDLRHTPADQCRDVDNPDPYYSLANKFVMLQKGAGKNIEFSNRFAKDKVYLKDMVYVSIFSDDKKSALKYLQQVSDIDFRYVDLYKASLYYFTWIRDFVNAEASYGSLDRAGYQDQTTLYYMLLYFLVNFNETRLQSYLTAYEETYKADYRSDLVTALMNLYIKNMSDFDTIMSRLLASDPYLFDKMFIEVNFEKF